MKMKNTEERLAQFLDGLGLEMPTDVRTKILSNLRSPAPLIARIERYMKKGLIRYVG